MLKAKLTIIPFLCLGFLSSTFVYGWMCNTSGNIVMCDNVTTYIDTQGNEFEMGTITFSDGNNEITILDRNLGAKSNDITKEDSKGYYFQRGNNYGFSNTGDLQTTNYRVYASNYGGVNPYISGTFITNMDWSYVDNGDLWGGGEDNEDNSYGIDADNWYLRQGPCPAGYHVPSEGEMNRLLTLWYNEEKGGNSDINKINIFRMEDAIDAINVFHFPPSGERRYIDASINLLGGRSYLRTSTPSGTKSAFVVEGDNYAISSQWLNDRGRGVNIRCFKDQYNGKTQIITLNYETNGGPKVQSQSLLKGTAGYLPGYNISKHGYRIEGWYFDENFTHKFSSDEKLNDDTTLYVKREEFDEPELTGKLVGNVILYGTGDEFELAYEFAFKNKITTQINISDANMSGKMTRIAMAKMLSEYAINVLGKEPNKQKICSFSDVTEGLNLQYNNGVVLACQLGIMGIGMDKFRPNDNVTRAEFGTALSRLLYGTNDGAINYYSTHLYKLYNEGIITNMDPKIKELRGYVMVMLMRAAEKII